MDVIIEETGKVISLEIIGMNVTEKKFGFNEYEDFVDEDEFFVDKDGFFVDEDGDRIMTNSFSQNHFCAGEGYPINDYGIKEDGEIVFFVKEDDSKFWVKYCEYLQNLKDLETNKLNRRKTLQGFIYSHMGYDCSNSSY